MAIMNLGKLLRFMNLGEIWGGHTQSRPEERPFDPSTYSELIRFLQATEINSAKQRRSLL